MGIIAVEEFRNGRDGMDYLCFSRCFCEVFFFFFKILLLLLLFPIFISPELLSTNRRVNTFSVPIMLHTPCTSNRVCLCNYARLLFRSQT